ncbi:hypothetical protein ACTXMZ_16210 [Brachybacterium alimentarium]|uniref:hypothetical protein n=1 Tax=Brachybacterium alimentarium TaxID=47845 RepID=UPI003FD63B3D
MSERRIFPDTSVAVTFACVGRVDLLVSWLRSRGAQCEGVATELLSWGRTFPEISVLHKALGDAVELTEDEDEHAKRIRISEFGGTAAKPLQHLGEAMTLTLLQRAEHSGAIWISDDGASREFAGFKSIKAVDTLHILIELVADGDLHVEDAWDLWNEMWNHENGSCRKPTSKRDLQG